MRLQALCGVPASAAIRPSTGLLADAYERRAIRPAPIREAPGFDRQLHGGRHRNRIRRSGDRRVHQHAIRAELHGDGRVRSRADAGVDDDRNARLVADDGDVVRVLDAQARSNRGAERHDGSGASFLELAADDGIVIRVGKDDEAFANEHARRLEQRDVVGEERPFVANDLELHPVREPDLARQPGGAHRVLGGVAARRYSGE